MTYVRIGPTSTVDARPPAMVVTDPDPDDGPWSDTPQKGGSTMTTAGAFALGISDVAFSSPPPSRPTRPQRRTGRTGIVANLLRAIHRELDQATQTMDRMPRITNYPY
jgi:hypothetical protein